MNARRLELAGAGLLVTLATVVVTWPQARFMQDLAVLHHDVYFSTWRLGWIAHALSTAPDRLFQANNFHPAANTLAFSDATLLEGVLTAPLFWVGVSPLVAYNLALLAGFIGSGVAMFVLARHVTGSAGAGLVAATIFTMLPYRIEHVMHLELQWAMFIPLAWWAVHRTMQTASWRDGVLLGVCTGLQMFACVYYGIFLVLTLLVFVPGAVALGGRQTASRLLTPLLVAGIACLMLVVPMAVPYAAASREVGARSVDEIARYSATPIHYLATSSLNRLWGWTADWGGPELRLFPGATAMMLACVSLARRPRAVAVLYAVVALVAVDLSFGPHGLLHPLFVDRVSLLRGLRSWSRFGIVAGAALALLAGVGTAALTKALPRVPRGPALVPALLIAVLVVEYSNTAMPLGAVGLSSSADIYKVLKSAPDGAVVELPLPRLDRLPGNEAIYQSGSLFHWKPLVNGYSGYYPQDYFETVVRMAGFPDDTSLARLRSHDVRYVIVHRSDYDQDDYAELMLQMARRPELRRWGAYRDLSGMADIFELLPGD